MTLGQRKQAPILKMRRLRLKKTSKFLHRPLRHSAGVVARQGRPPGCKVQGRACSQVPTAPLAVCPAVQVYLN